MALTSGTRIGPYEITAPLGRGGMGEVYRATDTQLKRDVAIKVLPTDFASDAERLARFDREARSLAALNHVNIAAIYGIENAGGTTALVMELVEGPTLAERIAAGPIPLDEALPIAAQIAAGLAAAHEQGIVHRDLKPANVKVRPDGLVKVLDFGLAKPLDPAGDSSRGSGATTSVATTRAGFVLGTAAYMSPEQARGRTVDKRTDIWAFGCVLYEMLTGKLAFDADGTTDTIAAVIRGEPDWSLLPIETPAIIRRLLRRCLAKDPQQRLAELTTARLDIAETQTPIEETPDTDASPSTRWRWAAVSLAALAVLAVTATMTLRPEPAPPQLRVDLATTASATAGAFAISPDGLKLAFVAPANGVPMLRMRSLEDGTTRLLAGTEGAQSPFWAPDGRSIGFTARGSPSRVDLSDGSIRVLYQRTSDGTPAGTWNTEGDILYPPSGVSALVRLHASRPGTSDATTLGTGEISHSQPHFLADGQRFIYFVRAGENTGIYLGSLDGATPRRLVASDGGAVFVAGHLVFPRQGALIAQPFDFARVEPSGEAFRIAEPEGESDSDVTYFVSASATGTLAFRPLAPPRAQLVWFSRSGIELSRVPESAGATNPELSSDGRRLAAGREASVWTFDLTRGIWARLTTAGTSPAWSMDGRSIAYGLTTQGSLDFYVKTAELAAPAERVLSTPTLKKLLQWSPDGRFLLYTSQRDDGLDNDILVLPLEGDRTPIPLVSTRFQELDARFSPDGRWIAYQSNETGRVEIWAQPFPGPGERVQISTTGGGQVQWRGDGQEIFYVALDERLMAVPVMRSADGARLEPGGAVPLFTTRIPNGAVQPGGNRQQYVPAPDGQSFLIRTLVDDDEPPPITLLFNWNPERRTAAAR